MTPNGYSAHRDLVDLTGEQPPPPDAMPMDGRQSQRNAIYERGPAAPFSRDDAIAALQAADLYPHGAHVVHEGAYDRSTVEVLVEGLMGSTAMAEIHFTDLGGAGGAGVLEDLVSSLESYARRTLVILDSEAKAREHVQRLLDAGKFPAEDVLLYATSFEGENFTADELVAAAVAVAVDHDVELNVTAQELLDFHAQATARAAERGTEPPSISTSLDRVVTRSTSGTWHLRKSDLVFKLAMTMLEEFGLPEEQRPDRPLVRFFLDRLAPVLNRPLPAGPT